MRIVKFFRIKFLAFFLIILSVLFVFLELFPKKESFSSTSSVFADIFGHGKTSTIYDDEVIIYNRIPKTGSTSFMGLVYDLCEVNNFYVLHLNVSKNAHTLNLADQVRLAKNITLWQEKRPAVYHGHLAYVNFQRLGTPFVPVYINLVRKPLDRLISYFYFLRYGDDFRPHLIRRRQGDKMTFDECVKNSLLECDPVNLWMQVPFFCGHAAQCWEPGSQWALEEAKRNLARHYFLVGITEDLEGFIEVLEFSFPRIFKGALHKFKTGNKSHLRRTNRKFPAAQETLDKFKRSKIWQMENELYEFAVQNYQFARKKISDSVKNGAFSQKFFYEKVRPK